MKNLICLIIILSNISFPQKFRYQQSIGNFYDASAFYLVPNGFIYVTDKENDEVIQLDTLGNVLKDVGGFGWNQSQFDEPVDVFADPLSVYVTDKNNHRIQRFDRNLNFISQLYTRENDNPDERFGYPLSCAVSNQGDLYVLDSENKRILKFDLFGNFKLQFGGIDAGKFALKNPASMSISSDGIIFVSDQNSILTYDQFGNGITKLEFDEQINSLEIIFDRITVVLKNKILFARTTQENFEFYNLMLEDKVDEKIVSSVLFNDKLYILTPKQIMIFLPFSE
ncbi:MAG: NHL repeat-containing protein [Ignavibacterium sp.]